MRNIYDANLEPKFQDRVIAKLRRDQWGEKKLGKDLTKLINKDNDKDKDKDKYLCFKKYSRLLQREMKNIYDANLKLKF